MIEVVRKKLSKIASGIRKIPDRKHYVEFITATLSVPVLLTVLLLNWNNLNTNKQTPTPTPQITREVIIREPTETIKTTQASPTPKPTDSPVCKKEIGPITISFPKENSTISDNPVNFIIKYEDRNYCSVVWSYRINSGTWSEYSSNSPSVYNMPPGPVKFELRVQSTVSDEQSVIERNFVYQGSASPTPTQQATPTPTKSQ